MANKEKFKIEGSALFGDLNQKQVKESAKKTSGSQKNNDIVRGSGTQQGLPLDWNRQTFIVKVDQIETLKNYAYTERRKLKDIVAEAFSEYIEKHVNKETLLSRPDDWR